MLLIDGYNLLHAYARGPADAAARERLIGLVADHCRRGGYRARIVFDASGDLMPFSCRGAVEIRTVREGRKADDEILETVGMTADRTAYTVVTDDREIADGSRRSGVEVVGCDAFLRSLAGPPEEERKADGAPPEEVDYWMKEFGFEE